MKVWVQTSCYETGEEAPKYRPDLGGLETDHEIRWAMFKISFPDKVIIRASGPKAKISRLTATSDEDVQSILNVAGVALADVDVRDGELDAIAESKGLNPNKIRKEAAVDTPHSLQSQEAALMVEVATKEGKKIAAQDLTNVKAGKSAATDKVLSELRAEVAA